MIRESIVKRHVMTGLSRVPTALFFLAMVSSWTCNAFAQLEQDIAIISSESPRILLYYGCRPDTQAVTPFIGMNQPEPLDEKGVDGATGTATSFVFSPGVLSECGRGTIMFWFKQPPDGYARVRGAVPMARVSIPSLKPPAPPDLVGFLNLNSSSCEELRKSDEWHHAAWCWDEKLEINRVYIDGHAAGTMLFPPGRPPSRIFLEGNRFAITGYGAWLDEIYFLDRAVDEEWLSAAIRKEGMPAFPGEAYPHPPESLAEVLRNRVLDGKRPETHLNAEWTLNGSLKEDTPTRKRICLNGYWRYQPLPAPWTQPEPESWGYVRLPGREFGAKTGSWSIYNADWEKVALVGGQSTEECLGAYFEREVIIPHDWQKPGRIGLWLHGLESGQEQHLFVNDIYRTNLTACSQWIDITDQAQPGKSLRLTFFSRKPEFVRDIWLEYRANGTASLDDIWITTSFSNKTITVRAKASNHTKQPATLDFGGWICPADQPTQKALVLPVKPVAIPAGNSIEIEQTCPWPDARCWSIRDPWLYQAHITLSKESKAVDEAYAETFGFKEIWIEGDRFVLNGTPVHFKMYSNDGYYRSLKDNDRELLNGGMTFLKGRLTIDMNAFRDGNMQRSHRCMDLLDTLGMLNILWRGQPSRSLNGSGTTDREAGLEFLEGYLQGKYRVRDWIWEFRNHPSAMAVMFGWTSENYWVPGANYACNMTRDYGEKAIEEQGICLWKEHEDWVVEYARSIDPTKLVLNYYSGAFGLHKGIMGYHNFSQPLQELEEQWSEWAQEGQWPAFNTEFMFLMHPRIFNSYQVVENRLPRDGDDTIVMEQCASYLGDRAYTTDDDSFHDLLTRVMAGGESIEKGGARGCETQADITWILKDLYLLNVLRMYRFYGISMGYHVEANNTVAFDQNAPTREVGPEIDTLTAPGMFGDRGPRNVRMKEPEKIRYIHSGKFWADHANPWYAFIAGSYVNHKADYSLKNHAFYSGETVEKSIAFVNDHVDDFEGVFDWKLLEKNSAEPVLSGELDVSCPAGGRTQTNFEFQAPKVDARTEYELVIEARNPQHTIKPDTFDLQIFPPEPPIKLNSRVGLLEKPDGELAAWMKTTQIPFINVRSPDKLDDIDVLVIARNFMDANGLEFVRSAHLNKAVENGLKVLVMEQRPVQAGPEEKKKAFELYLPDVPSRKESTMLGMRADMRRTRYAFPRAPRHPVIDAFKDADFANWRGSSDMEIEHPVTDKTINLRFKGLRRFPRWSNKGIVSFYPLEKPQCGGFRTLLDCEYDLFLTPLLETRRGKGTILISQLDITGRLGRAPVATGLFRSMLKYLATLPITTPAKTAYFGDKSGEEALNLLRLDYTKIDNVNELAGIDTLIVGPDILEKQLTVEEQAALKRKDSVEEAGKTSSLDALSEASDGIDSDLENAVNDLVGNDDSRETLPADIAANLDMLNKAGKEIADFISRGKTLIVLPVRDSSLLDWLPFDVNIERRNVLQTREIPADPLFDGIGVSDFFWRGTRSACVFTGLPENADSADTGLMAVVPRGKGRVVLMGFHPGTVPDPRGETKITRIYSTLCFNLGLGFDGALDLESFKYQDDKFPYHKRTINFEPYDHGYY